LLALAEAEVESGEVESPPLEINEAFALLHAWMDAYTGALEELGARSEERTGGGEARAAVARLGQALTELEGFKLRLTATQRLRPRLRHWRIIDDLVAGLDQVRDAYLDAFVAESLEEAEASGGRAQEHLDGVTRILDYFNDFTDVTEAMEAADLDDEFAPLVAGAGVVSALAGTGDLGALDRKGQELLRRITGEDLPAATGMGVALLHLEAAAEMLYDSERLWRAAREVYETLSANPQGLQGLFSEAQWASEVAAIGASARDAGFELSAVSAMTENRRRLVRALIRLGAKQFEDIAPPLLATLLSVRNRHSYAQERRKDANSLVRELNQTGFGSLLAGLDPKIRDADAHGHYVIEDERIVFTGTRGDLTEATDDELLDFVLTGTESVTAIYWGIVAGLLTSGVDPEDVERLLAEDVPPLDRLRYILNLSGWQEVELSLERDRLEASGWSERPSPIGLIAALIPNLPPEVEEMRLTRRTDAESYVAEGPVAPLRAWGEETSSDMKAIAFARASLVWTASGQPLLTKDALRKVTAIGALQAGDLPTPGEKIRQLREKLDYSRAFGLDDLAEAIAAYMRAIREHTAGRPLPLEELHRISSALEAWGLAEISEPVLNF
jgi:hypothetical protein